MFHVGLIYFREISVNAVQNPELTGCDEHILKRDLLLAMETARSRLAIAIAEESKYTSWDQRKYYLDTADRMRRNIARLRTEESAERFQLPGWILALEALREIPLNNRAQAICERLRRIIAILE
ncbi:MAG: hypothetical protein P8Y80_16340 [Acidobacteriota bacterium]|jgi:hypothetical protein